VETKSLGGRQRVLRGARDDTDWREHYNLMVICKTPNMHVGLYQLLLTSLMYK
jgi:hypothetical protein